MISCMRKKIQPDLAIILFLIFLTLLLHFFFLNPPILSDQMEYYMAAVEFPHLPNRPDIGRMRIGLILPVALLYRIFGSAEITYYCAPILSTAMLSISIYLIGKALFSRRVGFFSAVWVLLIPNLILEFGHLLPDIPAAACASSAFALLFTLWGDQKKEHNFSSRRSKWLFFLCGLIFGWSYLIKEYLAILFFLIPLTFWLLKIPWRCLIPLALGMLLMFGLEVILSTLYYQNPLARFLAASPRETEGFIEKDVGRILTYFAYLLLRAGGEGVLALMGLGVAHSIAGTIKKDQRHAFLLGWFLLIYLLFSFAALLPVLFGWQGSVLMRLHKFRYWIPILPPLVIGAAATLDHISTLLAAKWKIKPAYASNLCLILIFSLVSFRSISAIKNDPDFIRNNKEHYLELRAYLRENDDAQDVIWIDRDNKRAFAQVLPMYIRTPVGKLIWHGKFKYINTESLYLRAEEISEGYVIVDRDFMNADYSYVPEYLYHPPQEWQLVFESSNRKIALYQVD